MYFKDSKSRHGRLFGTCSTNHHTCVSDGASRDLSGTKKILMGEVKGVENSNPSFPKLYLINVTESKTADPTILSDIRNLKKKKNLLHLHLLNLNQSLLILNLLK